MKHQIRITGGPFTSILSNQDNGQKLPALMRYGSSDTTRSHVRNGATPQQPRSAQEPRLPQVKAESCAHVAREGGLQHRGKAMQTLGTSSRLGRQSLRFQHAGFRISWKKCEVPVISWLHRACFHAACVSLLASFQHWQLYFQPFCNFSRMHSPS